MSIPKPEDVETTVGRMLDSWKADARDAARMREIDALVGGGRLLDRERLATRFRERVGSLDNNEAADLAIEAVTAFAAALLTDGAVEACASEEIAFQRDNYNWTGKTVARAGIRAAIRAAGVEPPDFQEHDAEHGKKWRDYCDAKAMGYNVFEQLEAEKARADKAERERDVAVNRAENLAHNYRGACDQRDQALEDCASVTARADKAERQVKELRALVSTYSETRGEETQRADKAGRDLTALETVIAETSHAAGISGTMTPAARVRAMGSSIAELQFANEGFAVEMLTTVMMRDQARAEADALRAEVAALRGLHIGPGLQAANDRLILEYGARAPLLIDLAHALKAALATVPPAKVADAVTACADEAEFSIQRIGLRCEWVTSVDGRSVRCVRDADHAGDHEWGPCSPRLATDDEVDASACPLTAAEVAHSDIRTDKTGRALSWLIRAVVAMQNDGGAPKPEAPGLEPLEVAEGIASDWRVAITKRVNVLSAIAKRGGL